MSNESRRDDPSDVRVLNILEDYENDARALALARVDRVARDRLRDVLFEYATPVIRSWIRSGQMWREAGGVGVPAPFPGPLPLEQDDVDSLAAEVIVRAWGRFERHGLHTWSPEKKMSLGSWFVNDCKHHFSNAVRAWSRDRGSLTPPDISCSLGFDGTNLDDMPHQPAFGSGRPVTPAEEVEDRLDVDAILGRIESELGPEARRVFERYWLHQCSYAKIGRELGMTEYMVRKMYRDGLEVIRRSCPFTGRQLDRVFRGRSS